MKKAASRRTAGKSTARMLANAGMARRINGRRSSKRSAMLTGNYICSCRAV
jgi:hypothetical protein